MFTCFQVSMIKSYLYANRLFNNCNKVTFSIFDKKYSMIMMEVVDLRSCRLLCHPGSP